jgi:hypothetical protein
MTSFGYRIVYFITGWLAIGTALFIRVLYRLLVETIGDMVLHRLLARVLYRLPVRVFFRLPVQVPYK